MWNEANPASKMENKMEDAQKNRRGPTFFNGKCLRKGKGKEKMGKKVKAAEQKDRWNERDYYERNDRLVYYARVFCAMP